MDDLTLFGLRELLGMKRKPDNYKVLVMKYLEKKEKEGARILAMKNKRIASSFMGIYLEAVSLAIRLGVVWELDQEILSEFEKLVVSDGNKPN